MLLGVNEHNDAHRRTDAVDQNGMLKESGDIEWAISPSAEHSENLNVDEDELQIEYRNAKRRRESGPVDVNLKRTRKTMEGPMSQKENSQRWMKVNGATGMQVGKRKKSSETQGIRLVFKKDTRVIKEKATAGHYCQLCLKKGQTKSKSFMTGNVTAQRSHITRSMYPFSGQAQGWKGTSDSQQTGIKDFSVVKAPPPPPVTKVGSGEYIMDFFADADLVKETEIPKKTYMGNLVMKKVDVLDGIDRSIVKGITSRISCTFDGWTTHRRRPYNSFTIHWIDSPPEDPTSWKLRSELLAFDRMHGRHTGEAVGKELVKVLSGFLSKILSISIPTSV
ncbi:uncharacterized protein ARMOST_07629 [Armillaria ostoyae]|uniref:Uncharacterized protein n=1 Tax=Armillaria ostoyae TaxID=47428 RepID=A0A284R6B6_ARMOS|nr:uncharacterized protein ARMOST_07629 [Armillaria ostoyae]